jgi:hypothetical protein
MVWTTGFCGGTFTTALTALRPISITTSTNGKTFVTTVYDVYDVINGVELSSPTILTSGTAVAEPMLVYWQSSDLSNFPSAYAASLASLLNLPLEATTTTATGLSTSAKDGISVGAALGSLTLSIVLIMLFLRHRKRKRAAQHPAVPEMSGFSSGFRSFMNGRWRSEAEGKSEPVEMDSRSVNVIPGPPVELDAAR